jgi:hypothetical protein
MSLFCKVEDLNGKQYILTDKFKQPLLATPATKTCIIANGKKFLNNPELLLSTMKEILKEDENEKKQKFFYESFFYDTKIPYTIKDEDSDEKAIAIVNKSDIDFNIYDIATINKDIVITNIYTGRLTEKDIEKFYLDLFNIDKDNTDFNDKMKPYKNLNKGEYPPLDIVSEVMTKMYDYYQKLLIKEEYNNCTISDWTPCKDSTQTRKRTESTKIGKTCTPDQNNLPLTQTCTSSPSETTTETSDNNMYIGIGTIVFFLIVIAFGVYMFKQKNQNQNPYPFPYPNQQFMYR